MAKDGAECGNCATVNIVVNCAGGSQGSHENAKLHPKVSFIQVKPILDHFLKMLSQFISRQKALVILRSILG